VVKQRFLRGYPYSMPSFEGNLFTQRHQITSLETRDPKLSYGENPESLSRLGLVYHRVVTDRQTDRQTDRIPIANTRLSRGAKSTKMPIAPIAERFTVPPYPAAAAAHPLPRRVHESSTTGHQWPRNAGQKPSHNHRRRYVIRSHVSTR